MIKNSCNRKIVGTTSNARLIICVLSTTEEKTQVGWVVDVRQKVNQSKQCSS